MKTVAGPKILYLTPGCFDKGGISRYSRYQITALRDIFGSAYVRVYSLRGPEANGFETPFEVSWHGGRHGFQSKVSISVRSLLGSWGARPDVVHVAHVNLAPLALAIARLTGARSLLNGYGLELWSGLLPRRLKALRDIDAMIADCHFTADYLVEAGHRSARPAVVWDCVDLRRFTDGESSDAVRDRYGLPDSRQHFVVLSLGRLSKQARHKGFDRLIEAFASFRSQGHAGKLVIAGDGDDRPRLEALARSQGIATEVVFPGSIAESDLPDVYRSASVFSLVSDRGHGRGEGIPLTPLEAMACGLPILVGNQDGSQEAVIHGSNGFLLDPFDISRHAGYLAQLASASSLREDQGHNSRQRAQENFGYPRFVDEHRGVYDRLLASRAYAHAS